MFIKTSNKNLKHVSSLEGEKNECAGVSIQLRCHWCIWSIGYEKGDESSWRNRFKGFVVFKNFFYHFSKIRLSWNHPIYISVYVMVSCVITRGTKFCLSIDWNWVCLNSYTRMVIFW